MRLKVYRFGQYRVDPTRHEFWDGEERVNLQLKVFECLVYLIEHRDRAVCRDELISAVWGRADVSDNVLNQVITHARHATGDNAEAQRVIRTVRRFGYCWVHRVEETELDLTASSSAPGGPVVASAGAGVVPDSEASDAGPESVPGGDLDAPAAVPDSIAPRFGRPSRRPYWIGLGGALSVLVLLPLLWPLKPMGLDGAEGERAQAVVLPVRLVEQEGLGWARLGLMELISERLRGAGMAVVPDTNAVALDGALGSAELTPEGAELMAAATMSGLVLAAEAKVLANYWEVSIRNIHGGGTPMMAVGRDDDMMNAAWIAADRMAVLLGYSPSLTVSEIPGRSRLDDKMHQIEAYLLADQLREIQALIETASPDDMHDPRLRYHQAHLMARGGRYAEAERQFRALIADLDPDHHPLIYARALVGLAATFQHRADYVQSERFFSQAIAHLERQDGFDAHNLLGQALGLRGSAYARLGDLAQAQANFAQGRIYLDATGDQLGLARLDGNLAGLYAQLGQLSNSVPPIRRAIDRLQLFGEVGSELKARTVLVSLHIAMLEPVKAMDQLQDLARLLDQVDNPNLKRVVEIYRIETLLANGLISEGAERLLYAIQEVETTDNLHRGNWPQAIAARLAFEHGDLAEALAQARAALSRPWDSAVPQMHAQAWLTLMRAQLAMDMPEEAAATRDGALAWAAQGGESERFYALLLQAEYAMHTAPEQAAALFDQALNEVDQRGVPFELLQVADSYTTFLIDHGKMDEAAIIAGRVSGWANSHYGAALLQLRLYHALDNPVAWQLALTRTRELAGERQIPGELKTLNAQRLPRALAGQQTPEVSRSQP